MPTTDRDGYDTARETHDIDRNVAIDVRPVPEFSVEVVSPALHAAGYRERTGAEPISCDGGDAAGETHHVDRDVTIDVGPVPELAIQVLPPTLHAARGRESTRLFIPG